MSDKIEARAMLQAMRMMRAMDELRDVVGVNCTTNSLRCFLHVCLNQGCFVGDVQEANSMPAGSTARSLAVLFEVSRGRKYAGLIETVTWWKDKRHKRLYLTDKGQEVWERMQKHLTA